MSSPANVIMTSKGSKGLHIDFGIYKGQKFHKTLMQSPQGFNTDYIEHIDPEELDSHLGVRVVYEGSDRQKWHLTHDASYVGDKFMIVDLINGQAPTSHEDLIDKITCLL